MRKKKYTQQPINQSLAAADHGPQHFGSASLHPPDTLFTSNVAQRYSQWNQSEQDIIEKHRPGPSMVDDAILQIFYAPLKSGQPIDVVLEMNDLVGQFDQQLKLRWILGKIIKDAPEGELLNVARDAKEKLQVVITQDESKLKDEDDYIHGYRKKQLGDGTDISSETEKKDEVAQQLETLFPNGIMVCFSIPDSYLSKADAKAKIKTEDQATGYAKKKADTLEKMQKISYTNEAEFLNSAFPYAKAHQAVGLYGNKLKLGIPTLYTSPEEIGIKAKSIQQQLAAILGYDHPSTKIKYLAIFTHGSVESMSGRKAKSSWGYTLPTQNTKITKDDLPDLVSSLPLTDDVSVRLFACNTGRTKGVSKDEDSAGTGEGGFSDALRDEMLKQGYDEASVIGHIVAGHTIRNRQQRLFIGDDLTSFNIQVSEKILKRNLPDDYETRMQDVLELTQEEKDKVLKSMIWLYQNESWLIDFPEVPEKAEDESIEDYQAKYRKSFYANFFVYWLTKVQENRLILSKKYG